MPLPCISGQHPAGADLKDSTGTTPLPPPSIAATESATRVFSAFSLLQRVSHFCDTISHFFNTSPRRSRRRVSPDSSSAPMAPVDQTPSESAGHPSPLSPSVPGSNGTEPTTPHASLRRSKWSRTAPRTYRSSVQPAEGVRQSPRPGADGSKRAPEVAAVPTNTPRHEWPCWQLTGNLFNQIANYMIATQGTLDLL